MLGTHIATLRRQNGLSQAALADELSVSPSAIGMYERGRREPSIQVVFQMARLFNVSVDYLTTGKICTENDIAAFLQSNRPVPMFGTDVTATRLFSRKELVVLRAAIFMDENMNEDKVKEFFIC